MFQPEELKKNEPLLWSPGNGEDVWGLFCACASGDLETVKQVLGKDPSLVRSHHEYRTPLYFAVRENQMAVVTYLLEQGANPFYNGEDLIDMVCFLCGVNLPLRFRAKNRTNPNSLSGNA